MTDRWLAAPATVELSAGSLRYVMRHRRASRLRARRAQEAYRAWIDGDRSRDMHSLLLELMRSQESARGWRVLARRATEAHVLFRRTATHLASARAALSGAA